MGLTQNGLESLRVTWTLSQGPNVTGYTIYYQEIHGKNSGLLTVERTDTTAIITGLIVGATFSISVSATSDTLPSITTQGKEILIGMYVPPILQDESLIIRASVDALCRDGTSEISRDPRTKRLQTRRESLARPSKHTNNNF